MWTKDVQAPKIDMLGGNMVCDMSWQNERRQISATFEMSVHGQQHPQDTGVTTAHDIPRHEPSVIAECTLVSSIPL